MRCLIPLLATAALSAADFTPRHLYLTLGEDGSHSMVVTAQEALPTTTDTDRAAYSVRFDTAPHATATDFPHLASGKAWTVPVSTDSRWVHQVQLDSLQPATTYYAVLGHGDTWTKPFSFRTLPADGRPLSFVTGGDLGPYPVVAPLTKVAAQRDPAFICLGGDLFYENGDVKLVKRVDATLDLLLPNLRAPDGRMIPLVLAMGNHDARLPGFNRTLADAPFFTGFFHQADTAYFRRTIGHDAVLYVLDSGHATPVAGAQTDWLTTQLTQDSGKKYRFALYHVPLYPSHRPFDAGNDGLKLWEPLFDQFHLTAAFENHDHSFKRTHPLRGGRTIPGGTLYLGDGCWGVQPRPVDRSRPYLATAAAVNHLWEIRLTEQGAEYRAFLPDGRDFDAWPEDLPGASERQSLYRTLPVK
jgi:hypothetical protein